MEAASLPNPFPGFRPFNEDETEFFFGRDDSAYELLGRLGRSSFVAVLGASGSGKSSLVKCGVLPGLQLGLMGQTGSRWRIAQFRPRGDPIGQMAVSLGEAGLIEAGDGPLSARQVIESTLRRGSRGLVRLVSRSTLEPNENLLVFVDQFEELFRLRDTHDRGGSQDDAAFVQLLLEAAAHTRAAIESGERPLEHRVFVLLTMRSDFLGECSGYEGLTRWVNDGFYLVPFLSRAQRQEVIEGPVAVAEAEIEPGLVHRLLNDTGDDPSRLPILAHALMRTWEAWSGRVGSEDPENNPLALTDYLECGTMEGALDRHLDEVLGGLTEVQRGVTRRLFQRLTEVLPDGRVVRRAVHVEGICELLGAGPSRGGGPSRDDVLRVIEAFRAEGRTFLAPRTTPLASNPLIDIAHESLIWNWATLRDRWMVEEAQAAAVYRDLSAAAARRAASPRRFWQGWYPDPELTVALNWDAEQGSRDAARVWAEPYDESTGSGAGYDASIDFLDRSRRWRTTKRGAVWGLVGLTLVGSAGFARSQNLRAERAERARVIEVAAARSVTDPLTAALLLTELPAAEDVEARGFQVGLDVVRQAIPVALTRMPGTVHAIDFDPTGQRLLVVADSVDGRVARILDARSGGPVSDLPSLSHPALVTGALGDSGAMLAFDAEPGLVDPGWQTLVIRPGWTGLAVSPTGGSVAALYAADPSEAAHQVCVWSLGAEGWCRAHPHVRDAKYSPDGAHLVSWSAGAGPGARPARAIVWEAATGDSPGEAAVEQASARLQIEDAAYDAERNYLLTADAGGVARVWDLSGPGGRVRWQLPHPVGSDAAMRVTSVFFAEDGGALTTSADGVARGWRLSDTTDTGQIRVQGDGSRLLRDGRSLSSLAGAAVLSRLSDRGVTVIHLRGHTGDVREAALGPAGWVATVDEANVVRIWDENGNRWYDGLQLGLVGVLAVNPDGSHLAIEDGLGVVEVRDRATGEVVAGPFTHPEGLTAMTWDPRGRWLATAAGGVVRIRGVTGDTSVVASVEHGGSVVGLAFGADGATLLSASTDGTAKLIRPEDGELLAEISLAGPAVRAALSSRGDVALAAEVSTLLTRIDVWGPDGDPTRTVDSVSAIGDEDISEVTALAFSPDGRQLAVATTREIRVLRLGPGEDEWRPTAVVTPPILIREAASAVEFLDDSTLVAGHAAWPYLSVWTVGTRERRFELRPRSYDGVSSLALSASRRWVVTSTLGGDVRAWPFSFAPLTRSIREKVTAACLESAQRQRLLNESREEARDRANDCIQEFQKAPDEGVTDGIP